MIRRWFTERFLTFRKTAFRDPKSFFRQFAELSVPQAAGGCRTSSGGTSTARNLRENILPTRTRANLILVKGPKHRVQRVLLRRL